MWGIWGGAGKFGRRLVRGVWGGAGKFGRRAGVGYMGWRGQNRAEVRSEACGGTCAGMAGLPALIPARRGYIIIS